MITTPDRIMLDLRVTQAVIDRGVREDGEHCPIGIALTEALRAKGYRDIYDVSVEGAGRSLYFSIDGGTYRHRIKSRDEANFIDNFIVNFDGTDLRNLLEPIKPFDLMLEFFLDLDDDSED